MSRTDARDTIINELQTFLSAQVPPIPFYNSINEAPKPADEIWVTIAFYSEFSDPLCIGGSRRQLTGSADVYCFIKPGTSYTTATRLLDAVQDHLHGRDLANGITITNTVSADSLGADARFYGEALGIDFVYFL